MNPYLTDSSRRKLIFVTGKGGVGKSSLSTALAHALHYSGARVALATIGSHDPLKAAEPFARYHLQTEGCFREYALRVLKFKKLYDSVFDNRLLRAFIRAAPGLSDTVIAGKIWDLVATEQQDHLIVDLPSSGHAISFFRSPLGVGKIFSSGFVHQQCENIRELFFSTATRIDFVTLPEEFAVTETQELYNSLGAVGKFHFGFIAANRLVPQATPHGDYPPESQWARFADECRSRQLSQRTQLQRLAPMGLPLIAIEHFVPSDTPLIEYLRTQLTQPGVGNHGL